jgi:hypothetical protein
VHGDVISSDSEKTSHMVLGGAPAVLFLCGSVLILLGYNFEAGD